VVDKKGTGPTKVAYIKDFVNERRHPAFQIATGNSNNDSSKTVSSLMKGLSVKHCLEYQDGERKMNSKCLDSDSEIIAFNSAWFRRTWCGQEIKPGAATVIITEHCTDDVSHLFSVEMPPISGEGMEPIIVKSHNNDASNLENVECDISCNQEKGMTGVQRFIDGEPWSITYGNSDSRATNIERMAYRRGEFYSTQSFNSAIPQTFFDWSKFSLRNRPAVDWETAKNRGVYLINKACVSYSTKRHKYVAAMIAKFSVDSYGSCEHTTEVPPGGTLKTSEGRIEIMKQYRVVLAFDSSSDEDSLSSMIWEALISGSLPVLVGAGNMKSHLPKGSFVSSQDYSNWDEMANHVKEISENKSLWESYHIWRTDEDAIAEVEAKYEFARTSTICRLCRWAYAKKYGLGWDHIKQKVSKPKLARTLCTSPSKSLVSRPFQEVWVSKADRSDSVWEDDETGECNSPTSNSVIESNDFNIHRTVIMHDGVTDIIIKDLDRHDANADVILRMKIPGLANSDGAHFKNTHALVPSSQAKFFSSASVQDDFVKVTVLADFITNVSSPSEGTIEIPIHKPHNSPNAKGFPKRIRVILEDFDIINDRMTEFTPSVFCKKMIKDFVDPLELFIIAS
jgi:hypothetical protein